MIVQQCQLLLLELACVHDFGLEEDRPCCVYRFYLPKSGPQFYQIVGKFTGAHGPG